MSAIEKLSSEVVILQRDVDQIQAVVERLETAIAKITEVSSSVSQLLAVQDNKIGYQEKTLAKLTEDIASQRKVTDNILHQQQKNILKLEADIEKDMDKFQDKLFSEIKSIREEMNKSSLDINTKISKMQSMIYAAIGGGVVMVFLIDQAIKLLMGA